MKHLGIRRPRDVIRVISAGRPYVVRLFIAGLLVLFCSVALYMQLPKSITYAWGGKNCVTQPTVLPKLQTSQNADVIVTQESLLSVFNYPILSYSTCFKVDTMIASNKSLHIKKELLSIPFLGQTYHIIPDAYPQVLSRNVLAEPIPVNGNVQLLLNKPDSHFVYTLLIQETYSPCSGVGMRITCNIANQNLVHATQYSAKVMRELKEEQAPAADISFATAEPIQIIGQSIKPGEKVAYIPQELTIDTNRQLLDVTGLSLRGGEVSYDVSAIVQGSLIKVALPKDLPRDITYTLKIESMSGTRHESLPTPYQTDFYLKPGPRVIGVSVSDRGVPTNAAITVTFDQKLAQSTASGKFTLKQDGSTVDTDISVSGNSVRIAPRQELNKCASLSIEVNGQLENEYGITNSVAWSAKSRVACASPFSIGSSLEGRGITGYSYGSGNREVLYIGAIHGDEGNTKSLLEKWMHDIEGDPGRIPTGTKIVVIPLLNPDGYARGSRYNANGVDLNRNFAANNWKSDIVVQGGQTLVKGGGEFAFSEPESRAISDYIKTHKPDMVLSFHSKGGIVESNEAGNANGIGRAYASRAGYGYKEASTNIGFFNYDVNGSLEEWAKDALNQPVLLVELKTNTSDEFSRNKSAMWAIL